MPDQTALERYWTIIRHHGPARGLRRAWEQISQVDAYDWIHRTNTRQVLQGGEYVAKGNIADVESVSYYAPNYTASTRRPLMYLIDKYPILGSTRVAFVDLGCGRGKALHVARRALPRAKVIGIDLIPLLLEDARRNVPTAALVESNVLDVDYKSLLNDSDAAIVWNKNSFDRKTTQETLALVRSAAPTVFYIYSNPVFGDLLAQDECVFTMQGWHKNWNAKAYLLRSG